MRPYLEAREMCDAAQIMQFCAEHGFVHADIDCFVCAYPTRRELIDTKSKIVLDKPDCWYVYIAAGNLEKAFRVIEPKEFLAFERFDGRVRVYEFERFRRKLWAANGTR